MYWADIKGIIVGPYASYEEANDKANEGWDQGYGGEPWEFGVVEAPTKEEAAKEARNAFYEADVEAHTIHAHL